MILASTGVGEEASDLKVHATDLLGIIECSVLSFRHFIKVDKKKSGALRSIFGSQNQMATPVQQLQSSLEKVTSNYCWCYVSHSLESITLSLSLHYIHTYIHT